MTPETFFCFPNWRALLAPVNVDENVVAVVSFDAPFLLAQGNYQFYILHKVYTVYNLFFFKGGIVGNFVIWSWRGVWVVPLAGES